VEVLPKSFGIGYLIGYVKMIEEQFDVAIIDADSILYQIAHYQPSPALCKKAFDTRLGEIMSEVSAASGAVFIKGRDNFRHIMVSDYKGNRKDTIEPEVKDRIEMLYGYAKDFCIESDNAEADDYCGVAFRLAQEEGKTAIVCHIDKDLDALPGWHYNFRKKEFYEVSPEQGYYFLMKQILMGDSTDNIQGIKGLGPKTAEKILDNKPIDQQLNVVLDTYRIKCGNTWQQEFSKSANLIWIRDNADYFRELSFDELKEKLLWKPTTDTGTHSQTDQTTPLDLSTTSKTLKQEDDTLEESN
jgi:DNA polymerase-1